MAQHGQQHDQNGQRQPSTGAGAGKATLLAFSHTKKEMRWSKGLDYLVCASHSELQVTCAVVLACFDVGWSTGLSPPNRKSPSLSSPKDNHSAKISLHCWLPICAKINCFTPLSWKFLLALVKKRNYKNIPSWIPRTEINISWLSRYSTAFAGLKGWLIHTLYTYKSYFGKTVSNICLEIPN